MDIEKFKIFKLKKRFKIALKWQKMTIIIRIFFVKIVLKEKINRKFQKMKNSLSIKSDSL